MELEYAVEIQLGDVFVGIDMDAEMHPLVIGKRNAVRVFCPGMDVDETVLQKDLHGTNTVAAIEVVQEVEIADHPIRNISVELKVPDTRGMVPKEEDLVDAIGEVAGHGTIDDAEDTVLNTTSGV